MGGKNLLLGRIQRDVDEMQTQPWSSFQTTEN